MTISDIVNQDVNRFIILVDLYYDLETVSFWSGIGDFLYNGVTYQGTGNLGSISPIKETDGIVANGIEISLSGIDPSSIQRTLNEPHRERKVIVQLGFLSELNTWELEPFIVFQGRMDKPNIENSVDSSTIRIKCENRLIDMKRSKILRFTHEDQRVKYPNDLGFEFISSSVEKQIKWGM
ncbi:MAG: hypothetical protein COB02_13795 [Candidatus Cloacimonadota bacterium]|nr:MAG: hypothetical protein COB02_13795 [Candidatus Cloacimonadota bacterium]